MNNDVLLPDGFQEYIGQKQIKLILHDAIKSSVKRDEPICHTLISGHAGCGKSTLAFLIAKERGVYLKTTTGGALEKPEDIWNLFQNIRDKKHPCIFIDEVHNLRKPLAEMLYLPLEHLDCEIELPSRKLNNDSYVPYWQKEQEETKMKISPFTLLSATAGEEGELEKPFRDRFGLHLHLQKYSISEMETLTSQSCRKLEINMNKNIITAVAERSCFTPRLANRLLKRIREHMDAMDIKKPTIKMAEKVFGRLGLDFLGIDENGRKMLLALYNSPKGALGLKALSTILQLSTSTINNVVEPGLLQHELIGYMSKGRTITKKGAEHLKSLGLTKK